jgi:hypothetical protein
MLYIVKSVEIKSRILYIQFQIMGINVIIWVNIPLKQNKESNETR